MLTSGCIFGERALIDNSKRSATVVIDKTHTDLIILDKSNFSEAILELKKVLMRRRELIYTVFKGLKDYSSLGIENMLYSFTVIIFLIHNQKIILYIIFFFIKFLFFRWKNFKEATFYVFKVF